MNTEKWFEIFNRQSFSNHFPLIPWLILLEILTFLGFPLVFFLFKNFRDRGFPFSKLVALLFLTYLNWLGGSLKIFPFTRTNLLLLLSFLICFSSILFIKKRKSFARFLRKNGLLLIGEEIFFLFFFSLFLWIRWRNPDLWHPSMGGEKPMDFAFLNAILRSKTFPPYDPWFAGGAINYYYFGQLIVAVLTKITGILPSIAYNLALAFLFAQTALGAFTLIVRLTKSSFFAFLGSIFLVVIGNLAQVPLIIKSFSQKLPINAWYWTATRVMPNSEINEFPFFSFLYADLHAHLLALPIFLLFLALCLSLFSHQASPCGFILKTAFLSLILGIIRATNVWDYSGSLLLGLIFFFFFFSSKRKRLALSIFQFLFTALILFLLSNFFILPFLRNYQTAPLGLAIYPGPPTRLSDYLLIHGFFLFILLSFYLSKIDKLFFKKFKKIYLGALLVIFLLSFVISFVILKLWFFLFCFLFSFLGLLAFLTSKKERLKDLCQSSIFILSLFALFLTLIPDLFYSTLALGRMNTVFKFYYQAWVLFSLSSAASLPFIFSRLKKLPKLFFFAWLFVFSLFFLATLTYPSIATYAKIRDRMNQFTPPTLDGMSYMKDSSYFDQNQELNLHFDYQAINWLLDNIVGSPVILEGTTQTYRWGSRVSTYTGLPTVIGWEWHERAHRSSFPGSEIEKRVIDVKSAYETNSEEDFFSIVKRYKIKYIYLGELEKAYYDNKGFEKFDRLLGSKLEIVYQNPGVKIYKILWFEKSELFPN